MEEIAAQFEKIEKPFDCLKNSEAIGKESIEEATRIIHVFDAEADIAYLTRYALDKRNRIACPSCLR